MDPDTRRRLAGEALRGYVHGPEAVVGATAAAVQRAQHAKTVVLVEGISDQIAVETLAARLGRDLVGDAVVTIPIGGAHGVTRFLREFGPQGRGLRVVGLCDHGEADAYRSGLVAAAFGPVNDVCEMAHLGFHVCVEDLEDELVRALGGEAVERLLDAQGDLGSFRTLQKQPAWEGRPFEAQIRRFLGAGSRRKSRYARLMVADLDPTRVPAPLSRLLASL